MIPIIDLFAGPGGLCEGFSQSIMGEHPYQPVLSIEMDPVAHRTLTLRAFVHYFMRNELPIPTDYYEYVNGVISREDLFSRNQAAAKEAESVAWCAELGGTKVSKAEFDKKIRAALKGERNWLLIGGPPCQAYSLAGRSRSVGLIQKRDDVSREEAEAEFSKDHRQRLYRQYLRIIAVHSPAVFVMENVAGMLSARVNKKPIFPQILGDLKEPWKVAKSYFRDISDVEKHSYRIFSFVTGKEEDAESGERFLIRAENYGVPQCRHRVILLGIRDDFNIDGICIPKLEEMARCTVEDAISDLPKMKSEISGKKSQRDLKWDSYVLSMVTDPVFKKIDSDVRKEIMSAARSRDIMFGVGNTNHIWLHNKGPLSKWYDDDKLLVPLNHDARSHMAKDLWRYLFVSAYGAAKGRSPVISDFPTELLPAHANINLDADIKAQDFADRFKVQLWNKPASTVTSHISKDGHYFIHPDSAQCRSLTVREAARLQSFPDNYFFEGNRTEQYHQVGNAVPPYLANQIARIVLSVFRQVGDRLSAKKEQTRQ